MYAKKGGALPWSVHSVHSGSGNWAFLACWAVVFTRVIRPLYTMYTLYTMYMFRGSTPGCTYRPLCTLRNVHSPPAHGKQTWPAGAGNTWTSLSAKNDWPGLSAKNDWPAIAHPVVPTQRGRPLVIIASTDSMPLIVLNRLGAEND